MREQGSSEREPGPSRGLQPTIAANALILRPWQDSDALQLMKAFADPDIREWHQLQLENENENEDAAARWMGRWHEKWELGTAAGWAITTVSNPETILGQVAFRALYLDEGMAEVSYWVIPDYRGEGIAARATHALSEWAFEHLGLYRLEIVHSVRNRRSCRAALKAGFTPEGIKRSLQRYEHGARVRPAETPAQAWDRALLGIVSHVRLWTTASVLSAASALLALVYPYAALIPLVTVTGVLVLRVTMVDLPSRRFRPRPVEAGSHHFINQH
jgi:ribosomal-protein-alanine N-acetyltransferase